jgi:hypothetical protein
VSFEQSLKFKEWTENEQIIIERNNTIKKLTEDQLQIESAKVYYLGRMRVQKDLEEELKSEELRQ